MHMSEVSVKSIIRHDTMYCVLFKCQLPWNCLAGFRSEQVGQLEKFEVHLPHSRSYFDIRLQEDSRCTELAPAPFRLDFITLCKNSEICKLNYFRQSCANVRIFAKSKQLFANIFAPKSECAQLDVQALAEIWKLVAKKYKVYFAI